MIQSYLYNLFSRNSGNSVNGVITFENEKQKIRGIRDLPAGAKIKDISALKIRYSHYPVFHHAHFDAAISYRGIRKTKSGWESFGISQPKQQGAMCFLDWFCSAGYTTEPFKCELLKLRPEGTRIQSLAELQSIFEKQVVEELNFCSAQDECKKTDNISRRICEFSTQKGRSLLNTTPGQFAISAFHVYISTIVSEICKTKKKDISENDLFNALNYVQMLGDKMYEYAVQTEKQREISNGIKEYNTNIEKINSERKMNFDQQNKRNSLLADVATRYFWDWVCLKYEGYIHPGDIPRDPSLKIEHHSMSKNTATDHISSSFPLTPENKVDYSDAMECEAYDSDKMESEAPGLHEMESEAPSLHEMESEAPGLHEMESDKNIEVDSSNSNLSVDDHDTTGAMHVEEESSSNVSPAFQDRKDETFVEQAKRQPYPQSGFIRQKNRVNVIPPVVEETAPPVAEETAPPVAEERVSTVLATKVQNSVRTGVQDVVHKSQETKKASEKQKETTEVDQQKTNRERDQYKQLVLGNVKIIKAQNQCLSGLNVPGKNEHLEDLANMKKEIQNPKQFNFLDESDKTKINECISENNNLFKSLIEFRKFTGFLSAFRTQIDQLENIDYKLMYGLYGKMATMTNVSFTGDQQQKKIEICKAEKEQLDNKYSAALKKDIDLKHSEIMELNKNIENAGDTSTNAGEILKHMETLNEDISLKLEFFNANVTNNEVGVYMNECSTKAQNTVGLAKNFVNFLETCVSAEKKRDQPFACLAELETLQKQFRAADMPPGRFHDCLDGKINNIFQSIVHVISEQNAVDNILRISNIVERVKSLKDTCSNLTKNRKVLIENRKSISDELKQNMINLVVQNLDISKQELQNCNNTLRTDISASLQQNKNLIYEMKKNSELFIYRLDKKLVKNLNMDVLKLEELKNDYVTYSLSDPEKKSIESQISESRGIITILGLICEFKEGYTKLGPGSADAKIDALQRFISTNLSSRKEEVQTSMKYAFENECVLVYINEVDRYFTTQACLSDNLEYLIKALNFCEKTTNFEHTNFFKERFLFSLNNLKPPVLEYVAVKITEARQIVDERYIEDFSVLFANIELCIKNLAHLKDYSKKILDFPALSDSIDTYKKFYGTMIAINELKNEIVSSGTDVQKKKMILKFLKDNKKPRVPNFEDLVKKAAIEIHRSLVIQNDEGVRRVLRLQTDMGLGDYLADEDRIMLLNVSHLIVMYDLIAKDLDKELDTDKYPALALTKNHINLQLNFLYETIRRYLEIKVYRADNNILRSFLVNQNDVDEVEFMKTFRSLLTADKFDWFADELAIYELMLRYHDDINNSKEPIDLVLKSISTIADNNQKTRIKRFLDFRLHVLTFNKLNDIMNAVPLIDMEALFTAFDKCNKYSNEGSDNEKPEFDLYFQESKKKFKSIVNNYFVKDVLDKQRGILVKEENDIISEVNWVSDECKIYSKWENTEKENKDSCEKVVQLEKYLDYVLTPENKTSSGDYKTCVDQFLRLCFWRIQIEKCYTNEDFVKISALFGKETGMKLEHKNKIETEIKKICDVRKACNPPSGETLVKKVEREPKRVNFVAQSPSGD